MDNNILILLKLSELIGAIACKYSIQNNFNSSGISLDDILYGFNLFLNNNFEEKYSKIAYFLLIQVKSIDKYFSEDFVNKNNNMKAKSTLKEIYKKKKLKFDKLSTNNLLNYENINLLNKLYEE